MSTFDGVVKEFPDIAIDHFRSSRPPLAYFLSHVHSDHLVGLECCKSPFIYCSPGTRDILLKLERYPHRMNYAKGVLETRKQTYKAQKTLLKAIPLDTPTEIELCPGNTIRVTLLDANHCVGAVIFLIEGGGKAVLYTGDIRSEVWWVNALTRHPALIPYVHVPGRKNDRKLDCVYLDTTFVVGGRDEPHQHFPSKAEGITELLDKASQYPKNTEFYIDAWTFGYEDVWQALSLFLESRIHVDDYRWGVYKALSQGAEPKAPEAVKLIGYNCGNHRQQGCLSAEYCRLHSCERGTGCAIWDQDFVRITPIISRHNGVELAELGTGGGQSDLTQQHQLEGVGPELLAQMVDACAKYFTDQPKVLQQLVHRLTSAMTSGQHAISLGDLNVFLADQARELGDQQDIDAEDVPQDQLLPAIIRAITRAQNLGLEKQVQIAPKLAHRREDGLPRQITFPYSRHSSYDELCLLIDAFKPLDIFPCTVEERIWSPASSMAALFGHVYSKTPSFSHDAGMLARRGRTKECCRAPSRPATSNSDKSDHATPTGELQSRKRSFHAVNGDLKTASEKRLRSEDDGRKLAEQLRERPSVSKTTPQRTSIDMTANARQPALGLAISSTAPSTTREHVGRGSSPAAQAMEGLDKSPSSAPWLKRIPPAKYGTPRSALSDMVDLHWRPRLNEAVGRVTAPTALVQPTAPPTSSGQSRSSTPGAVRLAFREEAGNAAVGMDGMSWSEITLVSVDGHQGLEQEL